MDDIVYHIGDGISIDRDGSLRVYFENGNHFSIEVLDGFISVNWLAKTRRFPESEKSHALKFGARVDSNPSPGSAFYNPAEACP
jgi:hypothetical protein